MIIVPTRDTNANIFCRLQKTHEKPQKVIPLYINKELHFGFNRFYFPLNILAHS